MIMEVSLTQHLLCVPVSQGPAGPAGKSGFPVSISEEQKTQKCEGVRCGAPARLGDGSNRLLILRLTRHRIVLVHVFAY